MPPSDRHPHRPAERHAPPFTVPTARWERHPSFVVREAYLPLGDDYVIDLDPGGRAFVVDGRMVGARDSLTIKNVDGDEVLHLQGAFLNVGRVLTISRDGAPIATVRKRTAEDGHDEYVVELPEAESVEVHGDPAERAYTLSYRTCEVARITHAWTPLTGGYRVQIAPGQDEPVVLAVTICLDVMSRP